MAAGFQAVLNNHGSVLIDDTYRNMAVLAKGTQATGTHDPNRVYTATQSDDIEQSTYRWWDFGFPTAMPSNGAGIEIRNAANEVCFNSMLQYARVVDVFNYNQSSNLQKTYPSGRSYAVITAKRGTKVTREVRPDPNSPPNSYYNYRQKFDFAGCRVVSNVITAGWTNRPYTMDWTPPLMVLPPQPMSDNAVTFIVIDVTGY